MTLQTLLYNALLIVVDAGALRRVRERRTVGAATVALALVGILGLVLALGLGLGRFGAMRLFAYGLFGHATLVAAGCALLLRRWARAAALGVVAVSVTVAVFAFAIEPYRLEVTRVRLESPRVSAPLRILLLADLQTDSVGAYERRVFEDAMALAPDLVLMAGDYLQIAGKARRAEARAGLRRLLRDVGFGAPLGVVAVEGNIDPPDWRETFDGLPVVAVGETRDLVFPGVSVTALGLRDSFDTRLVVEARKGFHVVIGHAPDYALGKIDADLLLAGHTHGGQVRLPFIGPLVTLSRVPRSWAAGATTLEGERTLVVSRGIGMERGPAPRLRFLCRPQLVVIDVVPEAASATAP